MDQVEARRPAIQGDDDDDIDTFAEPYFRDEEEWEMEGTGVSLPPGAMGSAPPPHRDMEKMIEQLYVKLGSIRAGNTSAKLRKGVVSLLSKMIKGGVLNELQRRKILKDYIQ